MILTWVTSALVGAAVVVLLSWLKSRGCDEHHWSDSWTWQAHEKPKIGERTQWRFTKGFAYDRGLDGTYGPHTGVYVLTKPRYKRCEHDGCDAKKTEEDAEWGYVSVSDITKIDELTEDES